MIRILVANEPRAYRDVIAAAVQHACPQVEVRLREPGDVHDELVRWLPQLVVCSDLSATILDHAPCWVMLYPGGAPHAVTCIAGRRAMVADLQFADLLAIVRHVQQLHTS